MVLIKIPTQKERRKVLNKLGLFLILFLSLLAYQTALANDLHKVLVVSADHSSKSRVNMLNDLNKDKGILFEHVKLDNSLDGNLDNDNGKNLQELTTGYDLVIFSAVNIKFAKMKFATYLPIPAGFSTPMLALPWSADNPMINRLSAEQANAISLYYRNGGPINMSRLGDYLNAQLFARKYAGDEMVAVPPPIKYPKQGIYYPAYENKIFANLNDYLLWRKVASPPIDRPVIGISMRLEHFGAGKNIVVDTLIKKLEERGAFVIPFYIAEYETDYKPLIIQNGKTVVNNIINLRTMHAPNKRGEQFEKLGVPVLHAIQYYSGTAEEWRKDEQGIPPMMAPFMLSMPETAGVIDITTIAASPRKSEITEVIDEQLNAIVQRSLGQANLVFKPNAQKKITMMVWNYPSGEKNVSASFLNIPRSIKQITQALANNGYQVTVSEEEKLLADINRILRPFYREYEQQALLDDDLAELMSVSRYSKALKTLPQAIRDAIEKDWGKPENALMVVEREGEKYFVMPRIKLGNIIIMRQPPRGNKADKEKSLYHDKNVTVNHYYLAAYLYARQMFASDALIHLGTHGSQEYLPGKERSLSIYDAAMLTVGDTPVIYPFIVDDVGEAVQAKRRGRAVVISHMTPPFAAAGLYAESMDLHEMMHQYNSVTEGMVKKIILKTIVKTCVDNAYCKDIDWEQKKIDKDPEGFLAALHDYLGELAAESQPLGLHSFGKSPEEKHILTTIIQMLGTDFSDLAIDYEAKYFNQSGAQTHQQSHQNPQQGKKQKIEKPHKHGPDTHTHKLPGMTASKTKTEQLERGESLESITGFRLLEHYLLKKGDIEIVSDEAIKKHLVKAKHYYENFHQLAEINSLLDALSGKYVKVTTGGDPVRNPEVVPTGYNLYGFDPAKVPTKAAWEAGSKLTEKLIADYYQEHKHYPEKMAFSLWSIETMRHYGVLEAQVLRAMGVRPIWTDDGRIKGTEIIPYSELKRPRVDIVLSATGLYRDAFPNVIEWMAEAIAKVARLKEEGNTLYKHAQKTQSELEKEGMNAEQAEYLSTVRIFSNKSGTYGTGLGSGVMASDTWEKDDKLSKTYLDRMGYYYGAKQGKGKSQWSKKVENVDLYGKTLSGTDLAVFSRTSNLYGLLTSDDPFQYLGGISLAVRNLDGKSPQLYISNLRDANNSRTETVQKFMAKELRNRSFHPRWIKEMQEEGYSGAINMLDNLNNFWGWQVTAPESVREDQWQEFFEVYIEDKYKLDLDKWFEQSNDHSKAQMLERMLEAVRKDYWDADPETLQKMVSEYVKQASKHDYKSSNEKLIEYVKTSATGYGLDTSSMPVPTPTAKPPEQLAKPIEQQSVPMKDVEGVKLEQTKKASEEQDWDYLLIMAMLMFVLTFIAGIAWRAKKLKLSRS